MKNLLVLISLVFLFSACKKDVVKKTIINNAGSQGFSADTTSITLAGKTYTFNEEYEFGAGNRQANKKVDSTDSRGVPYFSSDKDSVLYDRDLTLTGTQGNITFYFIKKYAKKFLLQNNGVLGVGILSPADDSPLYSVGNYNFALDFNRENTQNGIAIELGIGKLLTSYNPTVLEYKTTISAGAQSDSQFKIISFKKVENGGFIIEAKFQVTLFDSDENQYKAESGYLKFFVQ